MHVRRKTLKPAYWFWISVRAHRDVMRAVPHINPRGVSMNYLQAWVLRLQSSRPFLSLLPVSPQLLACHYRWSSHGKLGSNSARRRSVQEYLQRGQRAFARTALATMPAIASTRAMLLIRAQEAP